LFPGYFFFLAAYFLFPLVYELKEPFFALPIEAQSSGSPGVLHVRNDACGSGHFGARRGGNRKHLGVDLAAEMDSPVYASKSGWARTSYIPTGYGHLIVINHPGGWQTRYGHLSQSAIDSGWVRQGQVIGFIGKTGNANEKGIVPHVHFEIRYKGDPVDPVKEIAKRNWEGKP